jgi:hypothetical protein
MMYGREKSDLAVVAVKPANKAERSAAEPVERRAGARGNAGQHSTYRAQYRESVSQALERIRQVSPSLTRGGSRMRESRTYGSGAARLAAIPAGESPASTRSPVHAVVISSGSEGDRSAESLEVKALWSWGDPVRSDTGGRATWQAAT